MKTCYKQKGSGTYGLRSRASFPSSSVKGLHGHGRKQGYGQDKYPGIKLAKEIFEGRSERSKGQDLVRLAHIAPSVTIWLRDPSRWDLPGIDTPNAQRIFEHRSTREKAQDLARRARKTKNIELWAGNVNRYDFDNVDTPAKGKHVRRFRVMEKEDAKKEELKKAETKKTEEKKHILPSKQQIIERAQELHMEKEVKQGLPAISAEESELKESGEFEQARNELMCGEKSKADAQIESYVHDLNSELEGMGYRIVPID